MMSGAVQAQPPAAAGAAGAPGASGAGGGRGGGGRGAVDPRYASAVRAKALPLDLAIEAASTAVADCKAKNYMATVQVTDSAGEIVVLLAGDGGGMRSLHLMTPKPYVVNKYHVASSKATELARTDPELAAAIAADVGKGYGGSLPIMNGQEFLGAITVSGTPNGNLDEGCGQAGLDKIAPRIRTFTPTTAG